MRYKQFFFHNPTLSLKITGLLFLVGYIFYFFAPTNRWFFYDSVEPISSRFMIGDDIVMRSYSTYNQSSNITWIDHLYCDTNNDDIFSYVSTQENGRRVEKKTSGEPAEWIFFAGQPRSESTCKIKSEICVSLPFYGNKCSEQTSETFEMIKTDVQ